MEKPKCSDCLFYDHKEIGAGICRCKPPAGSPIVSGQGVGRAQVTVISVWAQVQEADWCGEYCPGLKEKEDVKCQ